MKDNSEVKPSFTEEVTIYSSNRVLEPRSKGADSVANSEGDPKDSCNASTHVSRCVEQQYARETTV